MKGSQNLVGWNAVFGSGRYIVILILGFCLFGIHSTRRMMPVTGSAQAVYYPPPHQLVHFTFGYSCVGADLLWIRALQDFGYCEKKISESECSAKGWLFKVLDLATEMDPKFVMPHSYGALSLSVIASDRVGASLIFEKAVERFPQYWVIGYWAGYHALFEEKDPGKAARYLEIAARRGAPTWVYSLAGRLYTDSGKKEVAESLLNELEASGFDYDLLMRMRKKISESK